MLQRQLEQFRKLGSSLFDSSFHQLSALLRASATFGTDSVGNAHNPILTPPVKEPRIHHFLFLPLQLFFRLNPSKEPIHCWIEWHAQFLTFCYQCVSPVIQ